MPEQKVYLFLDNFALLSDLNSGFDKYLFQLIVLLKPDFNCVNNSGFDKYLFQLIVLLKPYFNCVNNFALSWVDKVTTGT